MDAVKQHMDTYNQYIVDVMWKHKIKLVLFTGFTFVGVSFIPYLKEIQSTLEQKIEHGKKHLTLEDIRERYDIFDVILDVRTPEEYEKGHVDGSINIDYKQLMEKKGSQELKKHHIQKTNTILVYCKTGRRATHAVNALIEVHHFDPDMIYMTNENEKAIQEAVIR